MAIDAPARIAILGAGPIGLEAALYARYLGYEVQVFEKGLTCQNLRNFAHVRLFSPFAMNVSPLGLAALTAQDSAWRPRVENAILTAGELLETYYLPLAESDLLQDCIRVESEVAAVGRPGILKTELIQQKARREWPFRVLACDARAKREWTFESEIVIDATGTYGNHAYLGPGGIPAAGELSLQHKIDYGLPDILGADRGRFANRHTVVVGRGYSAATNITLLADLAKTNPSTKITWVVRREPEADGEGPVSRIFQDRLPERDRLAVQANSLTKGAAPQVRIVAGTHVESVDYDGSTFSLRLNGNYEGTIDADNLLANVGWRPDLSICRELQVHHCYASEGPMKLASALLASSSSDCLEQPASEAETLLNPEPDFYVLGSKSYGRNSKFLLSSGLNQICAVFSLIGDRPNLDLYKSLSTLRL